MAEVVKTTLNVKKDLFQERAFIITETAWAGMVRAYVPVTGYLKGALALAVDDVSESEGYAEDPPGPNSVLFGNNW